MSTEAQPPSPPERSATHNHKDKLSKSPPMAFSTRSTRRGHARSSSFGDFVSRLLPSRRQEKGHTLRSEYNGDDTQDAVGLLRNDIVALPSKSLQELEAISIQTRRGSWPRRNNVAHMSDSETLGTMSSHPPHNNAKLERGQGLSDEIRDGEVPSQADQFGSEDIKRTSSTGGKTKVNSLRKLISSLKIKKRGKEGERKKEQHFTFQSAQIRESNGPPFDYPNMLMEDKEVKKTRQIFDDKKFRREQRRSLRESGDFLGVQGANPRTGYWDISDATSSSVPSQMSEKTKLRLLQQAKDLAEQEKKYEEARVSHEKELEKIQQRKEVKKKQREEQKKLELRTRQWRRGKWRVSENGWSSVAEPELSPIQQSVAGSPVAELAPGDRLFPMPCASHPTPYVNNILIKQGDYFGHRAVSSPLARQQVGQDPNTSSVTPPSVCIPRKPVGSPIGQRAVASSETIIHMNSSMTPAHVQESSPTKVEQHQSSFPVDLASVTVTPNLDLTPSEQIPFLDRKALFPRRTSLLKTKATAISFRSVSMKRVEIHRPLAQSPRVQHINSLNELPPVSLKNPIAARIPSNCQIPKGLLTIWNPPTIIKTQSDSPISSINTSTITTTGYTPLQLLLAQLDGASDIRNNTSLLRQFLQYKTAQIPRRTTSSQKVRQRALERTIYHIHPADIVISSDHQLSFTKERSTRLCQTRSPGGAEKMKSTPISTSTCLQNHEKQREAAQNAALTAFQHVRHQTAIKKTKMHTGGLLTPPKIRNQRREYMGSTQTKAARKPARDENVDIGDPLTTKRGQERDLKVFRSSLVCAAQVAASRSWASDKLAVWHPEPSAEKEKQVHTKAIVLHERRNHSPTKGLPRPGRPAQSLGHVMVGMAQDAWARVEAVFDPQSSIRKRFERRRLTWQDVSLFFAAALFMAGTFLMSAVVARLVGISLQAMRAMGAFFWLLWLFIVL